MSKSTPGSDTFMVATFRTMQEHSQRAPLESVEVNGNSLLSVLFVWFFYRSDKPLASRDHFCVS